ncbi:phosphotransferase [Cohnella suwonensis]|uniref:Phosphotransferase n=1 Tax=Cohnella suwonensis TaxID=696072 RepID=A0ABW0LP64_9BACL
MFKQALKHYFPESSWTIEEGASGWNNTTRYVKADGKRWVLRVYETHKDPSKVRFEHELLLALNGLELPFRVPQPILATNGQSYVLLEDGTDRLACLFPYIEGERPQENDPGIAYRLGKASGRLSVALRGLTVTTPSSYPPYYEMDSAHPQAGASKVEAFCVSAPEPFERLREPLSRIGDELRRFRERLPELRSLPHQLIHGDINCSNALAGGKNGREIAAILDFEFGTWDLRAMEFAVLVAGYMNEEESGTEAAAIGSCVEPLLKGAGEEIKLERAEASAIPLLVKLRMLDVFLHFLGRYWDGVDGADVLEEQITSVGKGLKSLARADGELSRLCMRYLFEN